MIFLNEGKTNWKYILIVVILAVLVGGGTLWLSTKQEAQFTQIPEIKIPEKAVGDETADWKTYRNEIYGYEVKYPDDWGVAPWSSANNVCFCHKRYFEVDTENPGVWILVIDNPTNISPEAWWHRDVLEELRPYIKVKEVSIARVEGVKTEPAEGFYSMPSWNIYLPYNGKMYKISNNVGEDWNTFNQILSTFRFLE